MIGQIISRYRILEKLGEGGMGVVYKAEDLRLKRTVALKFLPPLSAGGEEEKSRFLIEAQAAAALDHPNICTVYEIDEADGRCFISMAYIEGRSMKQMLESGALRIEQALELGTHVARGLQEAHEKGVVHRDIKSANILVTPKGQAKITDFGLALLAERTQLTREGTTLGTAAYMSPQQASGDRVDHRTDIWSLGVVLYEILTGRLPFRGERPLAVVHSILHSEPAPMSEGGAVIPAEAERIVRKALAKDLRQRYSRIDEMLAELEMLRRQLGFASATGAWGTTVRGRAGGRFRRGFLWAAAGLLLLVLAALAGVWWRRAGRSSGEAAPAIASLAVLPLENLSRDPEQEYFTDGMTRALIADLAKIRSLRVKSRTSVMQYKGSKRPLREIAQELTVDAVVEGSVLRAGDKVRITVQLIAAATDQLLWADSYERDLRNILSLQSEVARAIAREIQIKLTPQEQAQFAGAPAVNPQAYESYLKGRHYWNQRTEEGLKKGIAYFQQAIAADARYAPAHAGVSDSYLLLGWSGALPPSQAMPEAKNAARRAIELDDKLAEAHNALAGAMQLYDWDWTGAEREFRRALDLNPGYADAYHRYAMTHLAPRGRLEEAMTAMQRAQDLDPLSLVIRTNVGRPLYYLRRYDEAIQHWRNTQELDPNFFRVYWEFGRAYEQKGQCAEAISALEHARLLSQGSPFVLGSLGHSYGVCGKTEEANKMAAQLLELAKQRYVSPFDLALIYLGLNDRARALDWMEKAHQERSVWMVYLKVDPRLDRLRSEPRFQALLQKVGLDQ